MQLNDCLSHIVLQRLTENMSCQQKLSPVTFTDSIVVAQDSALLDDAEMLEHGAHLVLAVLLRHHPNKQFSLCKWDEKEIVTILQLIVSLEPLRDTICNLSIFK